MTARTPSHIAGLYTGDELVLCHLRTMPAQRLIHQQPCPPGADGHIVFPESVFFERPDRLGITPPDGKVGFRRLLKGGWLTLVETEASPASGARLAYQLSPAAVERFDADVSWKASEDLYRECFKVPPAFRPVVIEGGAS